MCSDVQKCSNIFSDISRCSWIFSRWNGNIVFDNPKEFDDLQVSHGLKVISNDSMEFVDHQVFGNLKGISIGSMDFDNPKVYGDTSIFDVLVFISWKF